jgi:hypothetical protein
MAIGRQDLREYDNFGRAAGIPQVNPASCELRFCRFQERDGKGPPEKLWSSFSIDFVAGRALYGSCFRHVVRKCVWTG